MSSHEVYAVSDESGNIIHIEGSGVDDYKAAEEIAEEKKSSLVVIHYEISEIEFVKSFAGKPEVKYGI